MRRIALLLALLLAGCAGQGAGHLVALATPGDAAAPAGPPAAPTLAEAVMIAGDGRGCRCARGCRTGNRGR